MNWEKWGKDSWINKSIKPRQILRIVRIPQILGRCEYLYNIRVEERFGTKYKIIAKDIEKKREAIKVAKRFMKENPKGIEL